MIQPCTLPSYNFKARAVYHPTSIIDFTHFEVVSSLVTIGGYSKCVNLIGITDISRTLARQFCKRRTHISFVLMETKEGK